MGALTLDPGRLTARLTLERPVDTPDGQGGAVRTYVALATLWALITPRAAFGADRRDADIAEVEHDVSIRYRTDIAAGMRFRKGDRLFGILTAFDPDEGRRFLVCRCRETLR